MNLVLLGPPGTGKGTIAKFIEMRFGCTHISTGDLLRDEVAGKTKIGVKIAPLMNAGKLVDDKTVVEILREMLVQMNGRSFVLDGFPRNLSQGKILAPMLDSLGVNLDLVLEIDSDEEIIVRRLSARRQCVKCGRIYGLDVPSKKDGICDDCNSETALRDDDAPDVVKKRLALYNEITKPLSSFYEKKGLLKSISGNMPLADIFQKIENLLSKYGVNA